MNPTSNNPPTPTMATPFASFSVSYDDHTQLPKMSSTSDESKSRNLPKLAGMSATTPAGWRDSKDLTDQSRASQERAAQERFARQSVFGGSFHSRVHGPSEMLLHDESSRKSGPASAGSPSIAGAYHRTRTCYKISSLCMTDASVCVVLVVCRPIQGLVSSVCP